MKIFIGCQNTANLTSVFAEGFRELGYQVDTYSYMTQHNFYSLDGYQFLNFAQYQSLWQQLLVRNFENFDMDRFENTSKELEPFVKQYLGYDLYIFVNCISLLPYNLDYPILKQHNKKIVSVFSGSEIRYPKYAQALWDEWGFSFPIDKFENAYGGYGNIYTNSLNRKRLNVLLAEFYADLVLSVPEQSGVQTSPYLPYIHTISTKGMQFKNNDRDVPKIVHIPSDKNFKQTHLIEQAIENIRAKGLCFEFNIYTKMPHTQVLDILSDADILIDEMSLFPAILSHEAMASGCVVLAGNSEIGLPIPLKRYGCPVVNINPENLESQIERVLADKALRFLLIEKGKEYIDLYATPKQAVMRLLESLTRYANGDFDYFPTYAYEHMCYEPRDFELPLLKSLQEKVLSKNGYFSKTLLDKMCQNNIISHSTKAHILQQVNLVHEKNTIQISKFLYINHKYKKLIQTEEIEMKKVKISQPSINDQEKQAVLKVLDSLWLAQGKETEDFEKEFATHHQARYGVAVSSCTTGLELVLRAMGVGVGDEIIVPCFSWVATASSVVLVGATPIFVDIERETYNTSIEQILEKVTNRTKAVIPVHLFGRCIDIKELRDALPKGIRIIEDAACASGSQYDGYFPSTHSDCAVFSFHPRKTITTGEGGMILTNDALLFENLKKLRNHGQVGMSPNDGNSFRYISNVDCLAHNYRMTDIQSSIGRVQLSKLNFFVSERNYLVDLYLSALAEIPWLILPCIDMRNGDLNSWQSFVVCIRESVKFECQKPDQTNRNAVINALAEQGIETRPGTQFIPMLEYYKKSFIEAQGIDELFPNGSFVFHQSIALPLYNGLPKESIDYVVNRLKQLKTI